jgi:Cu-processing system ATP-binding protein
MIRLDGVSKCFGSVEALCPLDLEIRDGERLGLFGHNGSGKTTLIRILLGLSRPSAGQLQIDGSVPDEKRWQSFWKRLGFMPERVAFYEHLSGAATLEYFCRMRGVDPVTVGPMLERVGLSDAARRKVGGYSKGMRQRLNLAQALLGDPEVLVLDEPIEGLDPHGVVEFFKLLDEGRARTMVISSHRLSEMSSRVDRVCVLRGGKVKALGTTEELLGGGLLPARIHIYPHDSCNGTLEAALRSLEPGSLAKRDGVFIAEVAQKRKTAFLLDLHAHRDAISHLHVEEPGLEGVYFEAE